MACKNKNNKKPKSKSEQNNSQTDLPNMTTNSGTKRTDVHLQEK